MSLDRREIHQLPQLSPPNPPPLFSCTDLLNFKGRGGRWWVLAWPNQ